MRLLTLIIRSANTSDQPAISLILDETELFPSELLEDMIQPFFEEENNHEKWFVCEDDARHVVGFGYCRAEPFTDGTWNLLAIGVRTAQQGQGFGAKLMKYIERALSNERLLIVETSGLEDFEKTRTFYIKCGYDLVATIPEYWTENDDKVIFCKKLN